VPAGAVVCGLLVANRACCRGVLADADHALNALYAWAASMIVCVDLLLVSVCGACAAVKLYMLASLNGLSLILTATL
jgi:hypothetical protein